MHENAQMQRSMNASAAARAASDRCVLANARSQYSEDLMLLPYLLRAAAWQPGTFVELGALDGVLFSNTHALERCFGWSGLLLEANSANFERLRTSGRRAVKVHSAVCKEAGYVNFTLQGVNVAAQVDAMSPLFRRRHGRANHHWEHERVPCRPLSDLMAEAGLRSGAHFLSLDVEGAEERVLETIDPACFTVVLVEMDGTSPKRDRRVHQTLEAAGLIWQRGLATRNSGVYLRPVRARWRLHNRRPGKRWAGRAARARRGTIERCGEIIHPTAEYYWRGELFTGERLADAWATEDGWWARQHHIHKFGQRNSSAT